MTARKLHRWSELILRARNVIGGTQAEFARKLNGSERTVQRWESGASQPIPTQLMAAARLVVNQDVDLAKALVAEAGGLWAWQPAAPSAPPRPTPQPKHLAHATLYAAAEAGSITPQVTRPALVAAARTMLELGLSPQDLLDALTSPPPNPELKTGGKNPTE
jgi:transcriptional regulator with XRE-family HTH domain